MDNKPNRRATGATKKPRSGKQSAVASAPETVTYEFDVDQIQSINISQIAMGVVVPKPPPRFAVQIVVVPKPPPR
ncbi:MAG TPA: hypothetical protein VIL60_07010 [Rhodanobacter sp.]